MPKLKTTSGVRFILNFLGRKGVLAAVLPPKLRVIIAIINFIRSQRRREELPEDASGPEVVEAYTELDPDDQKEVDKDLIAHLDKPPKK